VMLESLHLLVTMYRDRRSGKRRIFEIGEIVPTEGERVDANIIYKWDPKKDVIAEHKKSIRIMDTLKTYTNMSDEELKGDLAEKKEILDWLVKKEVNTVEGVGKVISEYYDDPQGIIKMVREK
jgi:hypothetical protein